MRNILNIKRVLWEMLALWRLSWLKETKLEKYIGTILFLNPDQNEWFWCVISLTCVFVSVSGSVAPKPMNYF